jgi:arylsulfatase B/arylsulfatase I/J
MMQILLAFLVKATAWHSAEAITTSRPHIVFVLADDYGFADVSYHTKMYGNTSNVIDTPVLDELAKSGVRLENYYVQAVCSPTRAALMTGRYAIHQGVHIPFVDSSPNALALDEVLLPQKLQEAGYSTAMVGKWHLGFKSWAYTPQERGFDYFYGFYAGSQDYWNHESLCWAGHFQNGCFQDTNHGEPVTGLDLHRNRETVRNETNHYSSDLFTVEAIRVLRGHAVTEFDKPLFLYLSLQSVHVGNAPVPSHPEYALDQAPDRFIKQYAWVDNEPRRNLSAMVSAMDEAVGNLTTALRDTGLWDNTLLIFSTDNGGPLNEKASNYPLQGGKASLWEGGVRGVGFVNGGATARVGLSENVRGTVNRNLMHVTDWFPTLCEVAGCSLNGTKPLDGVSAWAHISHVNGTCRRNEICHEITGLRGRQEAAIRLGDYKLVMGQAGQKTAIQLFNVVEDAGEVNDLASTMPDKLAELQARLEYFNKTATGDVAMQNAAPVPAANPVLYGGAWMPWMESELVV